MRNIEYIPPNELDVFMKRDRSQCEPVSLTSVNASIERYLEDHDCEFSLHDRIFSLSNRTLAAKKVALKKDGKGRKPNVSCAVSSSEENLMVGKRPVWKLQPQGANIFAMVLFYKKLWTVGSSRV